jgi:hypothetical protein
MPTRRWPWPSLTIGNQPWDIAAGVILAREAGGHVVDDVGREPPSTIPSTPTTTAGPQRRHPMVHVAHQIQRRFGRNGLIVAVAVAAVALVAGVILLLT